MHRSNEFSLVRKIRQKADRLSDVSSDVLRKQGLSLKYRASVGETIDRLIFDAFPLVVESIRRTLELVPYDVQIYAAIQLAKGKIAEMKTGEGKTLTATMPAYLHALSCRESHVVTVNDYLASRDHKMMSPVFQLLGLSTGVVTGETSPANRKTAYRRDVTYGTAKEFGFDFLRDRLSASANHMQKEDLLQRELYFVLVDEVDSVLIDEARTPLIIGIVDPEERTNQEHCFRWAAEHAPGFIDGVDYEYRHAQKSVHLKSSGITRLRALPQNEATKQNPIRRLYEHMENAIKVHRDFHRDQHYAVGEDGKVAIIDEFTGRIAQGRQWQRGIHQAVEAKEGIAITPNVGAGATVTMQSFFRLYEKFAGMSGTVTSSSREFRKVYRKATAVVPTHRPVNRAQLDSRVFPDVESKFSAVIKEIKSMRERSRAILVGSRSVERSEQLSKLLSDAGIAHDVLNANNLQQEAEIVASSGQPGKVTVATNMAGRGTDFILDPVVKDAGGLHVILTEIHESQRIDWQLIGRGSRQGQPGSFRILVSLEDEILLQGLGPKKADRIRKKYRLLPKTGSASRQLFQLFRIAQRKLERKHLTDRLILMRQDKERQERHIEMGQDPFCDVVQS